MERTLQGEVSKADVELRATPELDHRIWGRQGRVNLATMFGPALGRRRFFFGCGFSNHRDFGKIGLNPKIARFFLPVALVTTATLAK